MKGTIKFYSVILSCGVLFFKQSSFTFINMNTIFVTTSQNIDVEYDLASLGERIAGYFIDLLIIIAYIIIIILLASLFHLFTQETVWVTILLFLPVMFYDLACEVLLNGQSVGKKMMKIKDYLYFFSI